jgi:hypothetical protein
VAVAALAYKPLRPLLVSFDFSVPFNMQTITRSEKPYRAAGFAATVTDFLSMRMGLMGKAGNVRIAVGSAIELAKISVDVNYTLDLLTQFQPLNRVSLGLRINLGDGGRQAASERIDQLYLSGLDAYSRGDYAAAREDWETILQINPRFEPAIEGLNIIAHAESVQQRISDMQTLN